MDLKEYVKQNQTVMQFVKDVTPGHIDRYTGTLDYATARFNTILLRLSEDPLKFDQYRQDVEECFNIIQDFYKYTLKLISFHKVLRPLIKLILHISTLLKSKIQNLISKIKMISIILFIKLKPYQNLIIN